MPRHVPTVSVGVPVFSGEDDLDGCLHDLLNQSCPSIEVFVCDSASTDGTPDMVTRWTLQP